MATAVLGGALLSASLIFFEPGRARSALGQSPLPKKHKSAAPDALARSPLPDLGEPLLLLTAYYSLLTTYY
jgi:hypothetical protein